MLKNTPYNMNIKENYYLKNVSFHNTVYFLPYVPICLANTAPYTTVFPEAL